MDRQKKKEQVESIDDEVNVLHPLLHDIFHRLLNVSYVELTHGPNEMGADFVIERGDPALKETYYIGVIAKTEKILQNFTDVERQIDECTVPRFIRAGKQEVRLTEIWIVTTKSISQNAKDKISEKYSNRKIHFFPNEWLVDRISEHFPAYWHHLPTATGTYLATLSRNMMELDAQTSLLHVPGASANYIELDVEAIDSDKYRKNSKEESHTVNFTNEVLSNKISLLEAEMGFGKSKLVRRLAIELSNPEVLKETKVLPIFQPFGIFKEKNYGSLDDLIPALIGDATYSESNKNGTSFLLILDGFDEASSDPERSRELIAELFNDVRARENVHLLLTSRPFKLLSLHYS